MTEGFQIYEIGSYYRTAEGDYVKLLHITETGALVFSYVGRQNWDGVEVVHSIHPKHLVAKLDGPFRVAVGEKYMNGLQHPIEVLYRQKDGKFLCIDTVSEDLYTVDENGCVTEGSSKARKEWVLTYKLPG